MATAIHTNRKVRALPGDLYGLWEVIEEAPPVNGERVVFCKCACGTQRPVRVSGLLNGRTTGCHKCRNEKYGRTFRAKEHKAEYNTWLAMKKRCYSPNYKSRHHYAGKGVIVCDRWLNSFANFYADMGDRPEGMTLDRINNDGIYEPSNCRWADARTQNNNTSQCKFIEYNGQKHTIAEWERILGLNEDVLRMRLKEGWSVERALTTPQRKRRKNK